MTCPNCAAPLPGAPALCPRCGHPILEDDRTVRLAFEGDTIEFLGWMIVALLSAVLVIPLAWTIAAMGRWFCRNLHLDGGETVAFRGTGLEVLGWMTCALVLPLPIFVLKVIHSPAFLYAPFVIAAFFLSPLMHVWILGWIVTKLELSSGPRLHFDGSYAAYLGYHLMLAFSSITIIGWAWVVSSYYDWVAEHTLGNDIVVRCETTGWEVLWRTVVAALGSIPIVTIPWMWMWYVRWLVGCITVTRGVTVPAQDWQPDWA
jgi:hypothetical protein